MTIQFAFVDGVKPTGVDRALIRSHCMRGKNRRKGSRRSLQHAKHMSESESTNRPIHRDTTSPRCSSFNSLVHGRLLHVLESTDEEIGVQANTEAWPSELPRPPPSVMTFIPFASDLNTSSRQLLYQYFSFPALTKNVYPIKQCVDFGSSETNYFQWLLCDEAYFHSIVLAASAIQDASQKRSPAKTTYSHLRRTLSILNERLSDETTIQSDSTVHVILTLIICSAMFRDLPAARAHLAGLRKLLFLRGGLVALRKTSKLHFMIDRLALWWSVEAESSVSFFGVEHSWDPIFANPLPFCDYTSDVQSMDGVVDRRLAVVYRDLQHLTGLINQNTELDVQMDGSTFQTSASSIQSRLIQLKDILEDDTSEYLCLSMLAFLTTMFCCPGGTMLYADLAERLHACHRSRATSLMEPHDFLLWVVMVGYISVLDAVELEMDAEWNLVLGLRHYSWEEVRRRLSRVMWISCLHDEQGKVVYNRLKGRVEEI